MSDHTESHVHVVPVRTLLGVFGALIALTLLTVAAASLHLGALEVWVALGIAGVKALLVAAYFMHLRWDKHFYGLLLVGSLLFVALFVGLTLLDSQYA